MAKFFIVILLNLFMPCAFAKIPDLPRAGRSEVKSQLQYFSTKANYGQGGSSSTDLAAGSSLDNALVEILYSYDWRADWRFSTGMNYSWIDTSDGDFSRSNSGMNEFLASAQNWYEFGRFDIVPQIDFVYPFFRVDENADDALMGEGAMRTRGGSWVFWPMRRMKPYAYLGFEHRDEGRSYLVPYNVGVKFKSAGWWFLGEYRGYESIVDDVDTDDRARREEYLLTVNGGSNRFYSVNPSSSELAVELGTSFGAWSVHGGAALTVAGANAAEGWTVVTGISYALSGQAVSTVEEETFDIRREQYDESLFDRDSQIQKQAEPEFREDSNFKEPVAAPTPPPLPKVAPRPRAKPKARAQAKPQPEVQLELRPAPKKKKKKPNKSLDRLMNDTENMLEER